MDLKITNEVVALFRDKDSKQERFRSLYESNDFIDAYAKHTDLRIADDPKGAIGRADEWESHGKLQLDFLKSEGMKPHHRLLDVGCGVGRASRWFVPYLNEAGYTGIDISRSAIDHALRLSVMEGWYKKEPSFSINADMDMGGAFDFIWAHSVFTHLPPQQVSKMIANAAKILNLGGKFLFTYKKMDEPTRTGLKQFAYPHTFFLNVAAKVGLEGEAIDQQWPAGQKTIRLTK